MDNRFIQGLKINWERLEGGSYITEIPSLKDLSELIIQSNITFFVGENGTGKSTLLEAIAVAYGFNPEGGTKNFNFSTQDTHSSLSNAIVLLRGSKRPKDGYFLRAESFYNVASQIDSYEREKPGLLPYYGGKSLHKQSHGESFLALIQNRFHREGLYLLDEPEAALSPQRQLTLLITIYQLVKEGAQFIIATHSPILLGVPDADILSFDDSTVKHISYEDTESYQVTEMFINNKEYLLNQLLNEI